MRFGRFCVRDRVRVQGLGSRAQKTWQHFLKCHQEECNDEGPAVLKSPQISEAILNNRSFTPFKMAMGKCHWALNPGPWTLVYAPALMVARTSSLWFSMSLTSHTFTILPLGEMRKVSR